jgi:rhamnose transport system substrate-binding protein
MAIVACIAAAMAGCNSADKGGDATNNASVGGESIDVVFIPKSTGNPYFDQVSKGLQGAAKGDNLAVSIQGPSTSEATSQLPNIKAAVQSGAKALVLSANSPDALDDALDDAKKKGAAIITVDSDLSGNETHRDVGILPADSKTIATSQLELLAKGMNYTGDFAILSARADAPNQNAWIADFKDALKDPKYAKMKLVDTVYGDDESQKSSTEMETLMAKYPTLKGVWSPTSVGLSAAAQVLENSGDYPGGPKAQNGGIILTGLSTPNQMAKAVQKGVVGEFQLWDPAVMGEIAGAFAQQIVSKKLEIKPGVSVDVPSVGKVTVGDKNVVYAGQMLTFNKDNISKYNF